MDGDQRRRLASSRLPLPGSLPPNPPSTILRLRALDPDARYHVAELDKTFGGDVLMNAGLQFPDATHDFTSHMWRLRKV